ncbi:cystatin-like fold lipoprotein, partial [Burkholderia vietnamiensis]|uniref:cystatin-like fold lipoprotein n=1 Tax=Burkholderia vietnamiensis TaxID=60552 RepID=UPI001ABB814C
IKKLCIGELIIIMSIINSGYNHDQKENKYQSHIDKVMEIQQETHKEMVKKDDEFIPEFDKDKVNTYVFDEGKLIIISYKAFKNSGNLFFIPYVFKDDKIYYKEHFDAETYVKKHKADYKDIKVN